MRTPCHFTNAEIHLGNSRSGIDISWTKGSGMLYHVWKSCPACKKSPPQYSFFTSWVSNAFSPFYLLLRFLLDLEMDFLPFQTAGYTQCQLHPLHAGGQPLALHFLHLYRVLLPYRMGYIMLPNEPRSRIRGDHIQSLAHPRHAAWFTYSPSYSRHLIMV